MDPVAQFKENQKAVWAGFAIFESFTGPAAPALVSFAGIRPGQRVLDVGCGTGVVALTAARHGAKVTGVDLTPELIARAKEHAQLMEVEATFEQGDAEALPFPDSHFDVVVSQFGHMFAPRPDVATRELLRVLKPGGTVAFATWPPELYSGRQFALMGKYGPPLPEGVTPPVKWGDPNLVRERLGDAVKDLVFDRRSAFFHVLSPRHYRVWLEENLGPMRKLVAGLSASDPAKLAAFRVEAEALIALYFEDNRVRQDFLLTRAVKV